MKNKLNDGRGRKLVYLKQRLAEISKAVSYDIGDPADRVLSSTTGYIVFKDKPVLPYLVAFIDYSVFICDVDTRLSAIRVTGGYPPVTLKLQAGYTRVNVSYHTLVAGLAYLFLPSIKESYRKGNVEFIGNPEIKDFLDIVIDCGEELSSYNLVEIGFEKLFKEIPFPNNVIVARQYPGVNFTYIGLRYIPTGTVYLVAYNDSFSKTFEAEIREEKEEDTEKSFGIPFRLLEGLPGFTKILDVVEKAPRIIREYKEAVKKAYLGVKAYVS